MATKAAAARQARARIRPPSLTVRSDQSVHPGDEVLVERDRARRWAERDGCYEATFAAMNPS